MTRSLSATLALLLLSGLATRPAAAQQAIPRGDEFLVNTTTDGVQFASSIAVRDEDGYLLVWSGGGTLDQPFFDIFARRFTQAGVPLTDEVKVNTAPTGDQLNAVAARLPGGFVVIWIDDPSGGTSTAQSSVRGRFLDNDGRPVGDEFAVSTLVAGFKDHPTVAALPDGGFMAVWDFAQQETDVSGIFGRRFDADGDPQGIESPVNTFSTAPQSHPEIAVAADGSSVVTWNSSVSSGDDDSSGSIQARRFLPNGDPVGDEFQVNSFIDEVQGRPQPSFTPDGELIIVWGSGASAGSDDDGLSVQGRRFDQDGNALGGDFQINTDTDGLQLFPDVAAGPNGDFVVAWHSSQTDVDDFWGVRAQRYDAQGLPLGGEFQVNSFTDNYQIFPQVGYYDDGEFLISWDGAGPEDSTFSIYAQRYRDLGACEPSDRRLCLVGGRFQLEVDWERPNGSRGDGTAVQLTDNTGQFWFFREENVEMVVKVLDACSFEQDFWVFAGGLTNVRAELTVLDTWTGEERRYSNPQQAAFQPLQDTDAFQTCDAAPLPGGQPVDTPETIGETLPLLDGRFTVAAQWTRPDGSTGAAQAAALTDNTGYLWFFREENIEMVIKVLDACSFDGHYWLFAGGLTNVEVDIVVTDTETGTERVYRNPPGQPFQPIQDTSAFATCP
jgi:hypothetical protein